MNIIRKKILFLIPTKIYDTRKKKVLLRETISKNLK